MIIRSTIIMLLFLFFTNGICAEQKGKSPLKVSVVSVYGDIKASLVGASKTERLRERKDPDLRVIIKNMSRHPVKLMYSSCEGEQEGLSFTVAIYGEKNKLVAMAKECDKNFPKYFTLDPDGQKTLDIDTTAASRFYWPGVIPKVSETIPVQITAYYRYSQVVMGPDGSESGVQVNEISSEPLDTLITR